MKGTDVYYVAILFRRISSSGHRFSCSPGVATLAYVRQAHKALLCLRTEPYFSIHFSIHDIFCAVDNLLNVFCKGLRRMVLDSHLKRSCFVERSPETITFCSASSNTLVASMEWKSSALNQQSVLDNLVRAVWEPCFTENVYAYFAIFISLKLPTSQSSTVGCEGAIACD